MELWPFFVVAVVVAVGLFLWRRRQQIHTYGLEQVPHYKRRDAILDPNERAYFDVLLKSMGGRTMVFAKVRLSELIEHPGIVPQFRGHWMRVQRRYVDFVICDHNTFPVLAIVMKSRSDQRKRDDVLAETLSVAEIPLLHVAPRSEYDSVEVVHTIKLALQRESDRAQFGSGKDKRDNVTLPRKLKRWTSDLWVSMRGAS